MANSWVSLDRYGNPKEERMPGGLTRKKKAPVAVLVVLLAGIVGVLAFNYPIVVDGGRDRKVSVGRHAPGENLEWEHIEQEYLKEERLGLELLRRERLGRESMKLKLLELELLRRGYLPGQKGGE